MPFQKGYIPWIKGRKLSKEHKKNISESRKGMKFTKEHRRNLSLAHKGQEVSEELRLKRSIMFKGKNNPFYGKHHTEETKKKIIQNNIYPKGEQSYSWKGGIINNNGYIMIFKSEHPFTDGKKYIREHRLIMEKKLGRYLKPEEVVHHINSIRNDNRIENLILFKNDNEHRKYHKLLREQ